jgi:tetratricopeptide (TPR) repeat protein
MNKRLTKPDPWLPAFFLLVATVLAYIPAIRGGFIWDDDAYVTGNFLLRSARGLWDMWTKVGPTQGGTKQYYPLVFSTFWVEYHLWQLQPLGYHLVNVLLHALNAVLVWRILRRLCVPGALLAAAIFALHPVHVESVAWVTERKNVLSGLCYLASLLYYLRFLGLAETGTPAETSPGNRRFYFLSVSLFICALASKTVTATLPAVILLILWWKTGRIGRKNLLLTAPLWVLGIGAGLLTAYLERYEVGAQGSEWTMTLVERCLVAGRILWFYAGKLIWPQELTFIYPRWQVSQAVWGQYLFPLAVLALAATWWMLRKKLGRGPMAAGLFFAGTLAPALGFLNVYPMRYSYVADHFQYLASLGVIVLFAAAATDVRLRLRASSWAAMSVAGALLLALGALTWRQGGGYKDADQIWLDTLKKNPACWMAHNNLGSAYADLGRPEDALREYSAALKINPDCPEAHNNFGQTLADQGKLAEAIGEFQQALKTVPNFLFAHNNLGCVLAREGKSEAAIAEFQRALEINPNFAEAHNNLAKTLAGQGKPAEAIAEYRQALKINPNDAGIHGTLGITLAGQGKSAEAIAEYRQALKISPNDAGTHNNLGTALAGQGELAEAIAEYRQALKINPNYAQAHYNLGLALEGRGAAVEATAEFQRALKINPNDASAHDNLGLALAGQGKVVEAIAEFQQALKINPHGEGTHINLGTALAQEGKLAAAMAEFQQALKLNPNNAGTHNNLGLALAGQGKVAAGIAEFKKALKINPNYVQAEHNLRYVLGKH